MKTSLVSYNQELLLRQLFLAGPNNVDAGQGDPMPIWIQGKDFSLKKMKVGGYLLLLF